MEIEITTTKKKLTKGLIAQMKRECINIIGISGGKDSAATGLLAIERGTENIRFVAADTGHEHQQTYDYIDYLSGEFKRLCGTGIDIVKADFTDKINDKRKGLIKHFIELSEMGQGNNRLKDFTLPILERMIDNLTPTGIPFLDLCIWKGRFPGSVTKFCSEELKHKPLDDYSEKFAEDYRAVISWQGVRADESIKRAKLNEKDVEFGSWEPEPFGMLIYRPILKWKAEDCFEQHKKFGIKWNPLYELGMGRVGCMPCINARKPEVREIQRRFPEEFKRVAEWEEIVSKVSKPGVSTLMDARKTAKYLGTGKTVNDISHITHGIQTYVDWAMTARGGRQSDLINLIEVTEDPAICHSIYGLCE